MATTPLFLKSGDMPSVNLTPKASAARPGPLLSPTKGLSDSSECQLSLTRIIGTTTSSSSGFDCLADLSCFAVCAGSAAIVNYVDASSKVTQRLFRAKGAGGIPSNGSSSDPSAASSTPEAKTRQRLLRTSIFNAKAVGSPASDYGASPGKIAARQRTRSAACVSLSRDGKLLALGETGYSPRILIFALANPSSDLPVATVSEHSFGVRCLAFSPNGRWLCSVGAIHDGFIYLWAINPRTMTAKLHASNKCTSTVHAMCWMSNTAVVTVGTRHVKVWRIDNTAPTSPTKSKFRSDSQDPSSTPAAASRALAGRNCLLGAMLESTFHAVVAISETKAVLGSDKGDICLLDDADSLQKLSRVSSTDCAITSMTIDPISQRLWFAGQDETLSSISLSQLVPTAHRPSPSRSYSVDSSIALMSLSDTRSRSCTAVGFISDPRRLITVDASHRVSISSIEGDSEAAGLEDIIETAPAHVGSVLGTGVIEDDRGRVSGFVTWASTGSVLFLSRSGEYEQTKAVPLGSLSFAEDEDANELRAFRAAKNGRFFVSGDRNGSICLLEKDNWINANPMAAHQGEVNDIAVAEEASRTLIATCSRDRTIQLFKEEASSLILLQTIDQHGSSVNHLVFHDQGNNLISASSDRTIMIYTLATTDSAMAYVATRIITLKASPVGLTLIPADDSCSLLVSNMDRQLHLYDFASGTQLQNVKLFDTDNHESIMLTSIAVVNMDTLSTTKKVVVGVSSTDKSIRVHDIETGSTLAKDYGHSEGVTGLVVLQHEGESPDRGHLLISTGLDGTIMQWNLKHGLTAMPEVGAMTSPVLESPIAATPLRRVLSKTALAEFQSTLDSRGITPSTSRSHSPSRLRRQVSRYSLATSSSASKANPPFKRSNRSPSPPSPASPGTPALGYRSTLDRNRTKSVGNFNDINTTAEQLCKSLRTFRKKLTTNLESLRAEMAADVERELDLTVKLVGSKMSQPKMAANEQVAMDLAGQYSQKLAQMVEEKVAIEVAKQSSAARSNAQSAALDRIPSEPVGNG